MTCANCKATYDPGAPVCPYCRATASIDALARTTAADPLDRAITESLLARCDAAAESLLTRDLGGPLSPDELRGAVARADRGEPSIAELERAIAHDSATVLDGIALSELLDQGGADARMIRRGLAFLKARQWPQALEWWSLQRAIPTATERRRLLLLILEAFTHRLAGDLRRATELHARITAHPLYRASKEDRHR